VSPGSAETRTTLGLIQSHSPAPPARHPTDDREQWLVITRWRDEDSF
jgi:heme-degrading monooxygenase HmoA